MAEDEGTYEEWTVEELRDQAAARDIEGRSGMNKAELVAALEADDEADEAASGAVKVTTEERAAAAGVKAESYDDNVIVEALELEQPLRAAADALPAGDNSDALKAAMRNAAHGIAHIRKAQDQMARLAER